MKPAKVGVTTNTALASWQASGGVNSQIPLPLRRGSNKSEKGTESDTLESGESPGKDRPKKSHPEKSTLKSSILGSSSFCCASGQKEDYERLPSTRPIKKKLPKTVSSKKDQERTASDSPGANGFKKTQLPKAARQPKADSDATEDKNLKAPSNEIQPATKPRGITHPAPPIYERRQSPRHNASGKFQDGKKLNTEQNRNDTRAYPEMEPNAGKAKHTEVVRKLGKDQSECTSNSLATLNVQSNKLQDKIVAGQCLTPKESKNDITVKNCGGTEDLDCPCCDSEVDNNLTKNTLENCVAPLLSCNDRSINSSCIDDSVDGSQSSSYHHRELGEKPENVMDESTNTEEDMEQEIKSLQEELENEKLHVQKQKLHILELEKEVQMMGQLKEELIREKELRIDTQQKLIEAASKNKQITSEEPKITIQNIPVEESDSSVSDIAEKSSHLLLGYESRIRRYQNYISKLEKDNFMLMADIKKFNDLSPESKENEAKSLLEKLNQLEKENQQQQKEYESCLDEVANKLVHTLLIQKRLEEECKLLHLRVDQLELENSELLKIIKVSDEEKEKQELLQCRHMVFQKMPITSFSVPSTPTLNRAITKFGNNAAEQPKDLVKLTSAVENRTPLNVINGELNPLDKLNAAINSKIPAINSSSSKIASHKRTKREATNSIQLNPKSSRLSHSTKSPAEAQISPPTNKITLPSKTTSSDTTVHKVAKQSSPLNSPTKLPSVKRKRFTKSSQDDKISKDTKLRSVSRHQRRNSESLPISHENSFTLAPLSKSQIVEQISGVNSPEITPTLQELWSFNCRIENNAADVISDAIHSVKCKLGAKNMTEGSQNGKFQDMDEIAEKLTCSLREAEGSLSADTTSRAKDEGYSTMSSDLQQDSVADTTVSEHEESSATFLAAGSRFVSDDSVTECLDGSMTSSSDSGFGPLQQITLSSHVKLPHDLTYISQSPSSLNISKRNSLERNTMISTIFTYLDDYSQAHNVKSEASCFQQSQLSCLEHSLKYNAVLTSDNSSNSAVNVHASEDSFTSTISNAQNVSIPDSNSSNRYSQTSFGSSDGCKSVIECCSNDLEVMNKSQGSEGKAIETAEKSTLTEPEEEWWREKALAHFIDESIWSLYSSESDMQFKYFSSDLAAEISPSENTSEKVSPPSIPSPSIVITGPDDSSTLNYADAIVNSLNDYVHISELASPLFSKPIYQEHLTNTDMNGKERTNLERVASDSLLYYKDALHELEVALKPGLKTTRHFTSSKNNIPLFHHFSYSDIYNSTISPLNPSENVMIPEMLLNLEKTVFQNNYVWSSSVNPSRSSSLCSMPSSNSYQVVSDETDVDNMKQPSRKGSQDPDLSSASDVEFENLEHKDFVERWIQKEITENVESKECKQKEQNCNEETAAIFPSIVKRKNTYQQSHPGNQFLCDFSHFARSRLPNTTRFKSSPCGHSFQHNHSTNISSEIFDSQEINSLTSSSSILYPIIFTCENIDDETESLSSVAGAHEIESDLQLLDSELKEFNGDFYRLCEVGTSTLSLDHPHFSVIRENTDTANTCLSTNAASPKTARHRRCNKQSFSWPPELLLQNSSNTFFNKPTGLVKPMRPITLTFCDVPKSSGAQNCQKQNVCDEKGMQKEINKTSMSPDLKKLVSPNKAVNDDNKTCFNEFDLIVGSPVCENDGDNNGDRNKDSFHKTHTKPCSEIKDTQCSYPSSKVRLPSNQNEGESIVPEKQTKPNIFRRDNVVRATENPKLYPVRKSYKKPKSSANSPEKIPNSHPLSPKNGVISKRYHWRKEQNRQQNSKEGCGTAWIHLQANPGLSDPKTRASLLDSMAETFSSSGSSSDDEDDLPIVQSNSHLQKICREKRQRIKASRGEDFIQQSPRHRVSVINRQSLYFRFGDQEKAAISCFDFLEEIPTSASEPGSLETFSNTISPPMNCANFENKDGFRGRKRLTPPINLETSRKKSEDSSKERINLVSPCASLTNSKQSSCNSLGTRLRVPVLWNQPLYRNMSSSTLNSQDCEILDHVSLSDSCAESYSSTPDSFEEVS